MNVLPKVILLGLVLALSVPGAPAASACSELSIRNAGQVGPVHFDYGLDRLECTHPAVGETASFLVGRDVQVAWFHDEAGLAGLTVELAGPGVSETFAMAEHQQSDGSTYYDTPVFTLPEGFEGELTATLYEGTTVLATASAHTP